MIYFAFILIALSASVSGWSPEIISPKISNNNREFKPVDVTATIIRSLQDLRSRPVVVIFHQGSHYVEPYMMRILNDKNVYSDFWLMNINSTGSTGFLAKTSSDRKNFIKFVEASKTGNLIGNELKEGSAVFYGILKAVQEVPYGSGVIVFADRKVVDEDLGHLVLKEVTNKNIKLITIWLGLYPTLLGEERILKEVTSLSHGIFLIGDSHNVMKKDYIETFHNGKTESIIAHRENLHGNHEFDVTVDNGVAALHIFLSRGVSRAHLFLPNGYLVDLTSTESVERFSRESYAVTIDGVHEILLDTALKASSVVVGTWRLQIDAATDGDDVDDAQGYNFTIFIQNNLVLTTETAALNKNQDKTYVFQLSLKGAFNSINNVTLKDQYGSKIQTNLDYTIIEDKKYEIMELNSIEDQIINVTVKEIKEPILIEVNGKDIQGNDFVRMNIINPIITNRLLEPITVETGLGSQLIVNPYQQGIIYFEVTNNLPQAIKVDFLCQDTNKYLYRMTPIRATLNGYETITVSVVIIAGAHIGTDVITLTAKSNFGQFKKSILLNVNNNIAYDKSNPSLLYTFAEDCTSVFFSRCENGFWRIEVTAQDKENGLKRVFSNPPNLHFPQNYFTGTKDIVTGYYTGSCCEPKIEIVAIDLMNNRVSYTTHAYYTPKGIGIIVGLTLLILLIIIVIIIVVLKWGKCNCKRKQKGSMDIPPVQYRGPVNSASTRRY